MIKKIFIAIIRYCFPKELLDKEDFLTCFRYNGYLGRGLGFLIVVYLTISIVILAPIRSTTEPLVPRDIKVYSSPEYPEGYTTISNFISEMERLKSRLVVDRIGYGLIIDNRRHEQEAIIPMMRKFLTVCRESICRAPVSTGANNNIIKADNNIRLNYNNPALFKIYLGSTISSLKDYREELKNGQASFYINSNNFIELLMSFQVLLETAASESTNVSFFDEDRAFYRMRSTLTYVYYFMKYFQSEAGFQEKLEKKLGSGTYQKTLDNLKFAINSEPFIIFEWLGAYSRMTSSTRQIASDIDKMIKQLDKG